MEPVTTPETPKGAERLTTERVAEILAADKLAGARYAEQTADPMEVAALAREVLELRAERQAVFECARTVVGSPVPPKEERDGE